jgi:hypothetical protein
MPFYSYHIPEASYTIIKELNLKKGFKLVEICFQDFPKEQDNLLFIVLDNIHLENVKEKILVESMKAYYNHLLISWYKSNDVNDDIASVD